MQHTATSSCEMSSPSTSPRVSATETRHHYPVIQQPIHSNNSASANDFRLPNAPSTQIVSSSTCSPPSAAPSHVIMRPPPPPPPLPLKVARNFSHHHESKPVHITHQEEPTSSIPDLEFDGTTVLCRVCGDKASGFHYGVHSCEGCKGFFRRSIQQKIQYRPCTKNQQCSILRINRNRCQYCRLKKCIAVGMSRDAVRFGRVPKREKARILAAMQQSTNSRSQEKALTAELEDDQRLLNTVVRAHLETCDFTRDKVEPMLLRARTQPSFTACPPTLACPLNPNPQPLTGQQELLQDFSKRFSPAIRGVVEFAKRITGFALLPQDDQVTLLKAGVFEVLLVRLACMFDAQNNTMICLNGQVLKRDSIHNSSNARFLMDSMFDFAERLNSLNLSDAEIGLFSSIVVIAADRPGLRNVELIEKMHNKLKQLLQTVLAQNHPGQPNLCQELIKKIPDLRTLNTLHSEKLLAFKMTEQQQQLQQQQQQGLWNGANGGSSPPMKFKQEPNEYHVRRHLDECDTKSPVGSSSWSSSSEGGAIEEVKSPMSSVSSTESACSGEVAALNEHAAHATGVSQHATNAPLLAATLAASVCPLRHRENSVGSLSGDDDAAATPNGGSAAGVAHSYPHLQLKLQQPQQHAASQHMMGHKTTLFRKLDSPCDSGIESGTEKIEKLTNSEPTSVCSSPRSSHDDKDDHHNGHHLHHHHHHHHSLAHHHNQTNNQNGVQSIEDMPVLKRVLQAPPLYDTNSLMDEAYKPHKKFRALRNKDTAEAEPAVINTGSGNHQNHSSSSQLQQHLTSSLSSTHSTLAKSLMEGPRMTPEQMKRTDIIHSFIMRGADALENNTTTRASPNHQSCYVTKWENDPGSSSSGTTSVGTSVITSSGRPQAASSPYSLLRSQSCSPQQAAVEQQLTKVYLRGSPTASCLSSSSSPVHFVHHSQSRALSQSPPMLASPVTGHHHHHLHRGPSPLLHSPVSSHSPSVSPPAHMMSTVNLQVGITNSSQQPLNLSKKTPPSSPRPLSTSTTTPKIVSMEA